MLEKQRDHPGIQPATIHQLGVDHAKLDKEIQGAILEGAGAKEITKGEDIKGPRAEAAKG
jgi:hypothetical protein